MTETADALTAWETRCKAQGLFMTAPRRAILTALLRHDDASDAVALLQAAREHHTGTSMGTVYRFLRDLEQRGLTHAQVQPHGRIRWRLCDVSPAAPEPSADEVRVMLDQMQDFLRGLEKLGLAEVLRSPNPTAVLPALQPAGHEPDRPALYLLLQIAERLGYRLQQQTNPPY